jgi:hypothetical protein
VSNERGFLVSRLLGLVPYPRKSRRGGRRQRGVPREESTAQEGSTEPAEQDGETGENQDGADELEQSDDFGLAKLLGEEPYETDENGETEAAAATNSAEQSSEDPPVLATEDFLTLCQNLEEMFLDIE